MKITRRYTTQGQDPYASLEFEARDSRIVNPDGSIVFEAPDVMVPSTWSQVAVDVLAQKYFRKAGVAASLKVVQEDGVPEWLWRSVPDTDELEGLPESDRCLLYTSPSPRDQRGSRMPSSA